MKKLFIILTVMLNAYALYAQKETGIISVLPKAGVNIANFIGDGNSKSKIGVNVGLDCEAFLSKKVGFSAGVFYSMQGARGNTIKYQDETLKMKISAGYLKVPFMLNLYANKHVAFKTGVQLGFLLHDSYIMDYISDDIKTSASPNVSDLGYDLHKVELSVPVGFSYEISNFIVDARYNIGITKMCKGVNTHNSVFQILLGYRFQ